MVEFDTKKEGFVIKIFKTGNLNYAIEATQKGRSFPNTLRKVYAEKIDRFYLLRKDTPGRSDKIFGISTLEEVDKRLYDVIKNEILPELKFVYGEHSLIKVVDNTPFGKLEQKTIEFRD